MLHHSLLLVIRHLWKNRFYSLLTIAGLAIGLSAALIIFRVVSYDFSFDRQQPDKDRIYRLVTQPQTNGVSPGLAGVPLPVALNDFSQVGGVELAVPIIREWTNVRVPQSQGASSFFIEPKDLILTNARYFRFFPHQTIAGAGVSATAQPVLMRPNEVILTESRAKKYFPTLTPQQVIGQTIIYFDSVAVQVTGVVTDLPYLSSFDNKEFMSLSTSKQLTADNHQWQAANSNQQVLLRLSPAADPMRLQEAIANWQQKPLPGSHLVLQPFSDIHFGVDYHEPMVHADRRLLLRLIGLAFFLLALGIINYINLTTAQLPARAKEMGISKILGSPHRLIVGRIIGESFVLTSLALCLALMLTRLFLPTYSYLLPAGSADFSDGLLTGLFLSGILIFVSLSTGLYPAWLLIRFQPANILRNQLSRTPQPQLSLRKGLIVFQFVIAQVFIFGSIIVYRQLSFALNHPMGFAHKNVYTCLTPIESAGDSSLRTETFLAQIRQIPGVLSASTGNLPADLSRRTWLFTYTDKNGPASVSIDGRYVDTAYLHTYRIPLLAGRNLRPSATASELLLNEAAVKAMGFKRPEDAIGKLVPENATQPLPIVGVIRNFHNTSLHEAIKPLFLAYDKRGFDHITIRIAPENLASQTSTMAAIAQRWHALFPDSDFGLLPYDTDIQLFYSKEETLLETAALATGIAIFISCLGLFGLSTFLTHQRAKEIAIRKVMGASIANILSMLARDFVRLVLIATALAAPVAWYSMRQWLQGFAYKVELSWWLFILTGVLATILALLTIGMQSLKAASRNPVRSLQSP